MSSELTVGDLLGKHTDVNFDEPEPGINRPATLLGVLIALTVISWACICFRLYARFFVLRAPGWDDLFVGLYLVTTTMCSVAVSQGPKNGLGRHLLTLTVSEFTNFLQAFYFMNGSYIASTALIKLSLLFQFLRLFPRGSRPRLLCKIVIVVTSLWGLAYFFVSWFPCFPPSDYWKNPTSSECYGFGVGMTHPDQFAAAFEGHAASNTVLDITVLALPFPLLWEKDTNMRVKMGIAALLVVGVVANTLSIWRMVNVIEHKAGFAPVADPTWYGPISITLAVLEVNLAAICASIPIFWPVIEKQFGRIFVTQEIKITSEERWQPNFSDDQSETALNERPTHSRGNSDVDMKEPSSTNKMGSVKGKYYDEFMLSQIDPLRDRGLNSPNAKAVIQSQGNVSNKWWRLT